MVMFVFDTYILCLIYDKKYVESFLVVELYTIVISSNNRIFYFILTSDDSRGQSISAIYKVMMLSIGELPIST